MLAQGPKLGDEAPVLWRDGAGTPSFSSQPRETRAAGLAGRLTLVAAAPQETRSATHGRSTGTFEKPSSHQFTILDLSDSHSSSLNHSFFILLIHSAKLPALKGGLGWW